MLKKSMIEASAATGVSAETLSALGYAAKQTGVDLGALHAGLRGMAKFTAQVAAGNKSALKILDQLGISAASFMAASPEQRLALLADGLRNISDPGLRAALAIAKRWEAGSATGIKPVAGSGGAIKFVYGAQQPSIVCAVLQVCDVALQPGEQVNSINLGDTARWTVEPAITGSGATEVQHLIIKPMDVGLETSLVVTTNRRSYHFRLRSHRTEYMPQVSFTYPEEAQAKWDAIQRREKQEKGRAHAHLHQSIVVRKVTVRV